jgi:hypothetical protein
MSAITSLTPSIAYRDDLLNFIRLHSSVCFVQRGLEGLPSFLSVLNTACHCMGSVDTRSYTFIVQIVPFGDEASKLVRRKKDI